METKCESKYVALFKKYLDKNSIDNINSYLDKVFNYEYTIITEKDDINRYIKNESLSNDECETIRQITFGYNSSEYNDMLRGRRGFDANLLKSINKISSIINNKPSKVSNIIAYRGVPISYFKDYGIENIGDLSKLSQIIIDPGFVATSLLKEKCYYGRLVEGGKEYYNILLQYIIPEDFDDGLFLDGYYMTYYEEEKEYLINKSSLSVISDIDICEEQNMAVISLVMVPKKVYEKNYIIQEGESR